METPVTELALTLGTWGGTPPGQEDQLRVAEGLARWAARTGIQLRIEVYMDAPWDLAVLRFLVGLARETSPVTPVTRLEPRSDRWKRLHQEGVTEGVFEVPVGADAASARFSPLGVERSPGFAAEAARDAALAGVVPEIALVDICRARDQDVFRVAQAVSRELLPRNVQPLWRLVDETGLGDPLPGAKRPRSLASWVRWLRDECGISETAMTVQASDLRGLGLANTLAGVRASAGAATSLFGLGLRAGWGATETMLIHELGTGAALHELLALQDVLVAEGRRDDFRPVSGRKVWQMLGGTTPEDLSSKWKAQIALDARKLIGRDPEPLLTALSGHAGLLHLMHRRHPELHFESDGSESLAISARFEEQFDTGRQQPIAWSELEPQVKASLLLEDKSGEGAGTETGSPQTDGNNGVSAH